MTLDQLDTWIEARDAEAADRRAEAAAPAHAAADGTDGHPAGLLARIVHTGFRPLGRRALGLAAAAVLARRKPAP
jgi:hypothetical protein